LNLEAFSLNEESNQKASRFPLCFLIVHRCAIQIHIRTGSFPVQKTHLPTRTGTVSATKDTP
jgi:hypothetical protein